MLLYDNQLHHKDYIEIKLLKFLALKPKFDSLETLYIALGIGVLSNLFKYNHEFTLTFLPAGSDFTSEIFTMYMKKCFTYGNVYKT